MSPLPGRQEKEARLAELWCDAALVGLAPHEQTEVAQLLVELGMRPNGVEEKSFENAAAAVALASLAFRAEAMPDALAALVEERALGAVGLAPQSERIATAAKITSIGEYRASRLPMAMAWVAAAACFMLAIAAYWLRPREVVITKMVTTPVTAPSAILPPSAKVERDALLARAGSTQVEWSATKDDAAKSAVGDVVWNASEQKGFMRFHGLAKNDPRVSQYQLWIFDSARDQHFPVDGGVFDVDKESGDVIVPITARVAVTDATLFAVTVEKPGGVVVSKRERIVLTAKTHA